MWSACLIECLVEASGQPAQPTVTDLRPTCGPDFPGTTIIGVTTTSPILRTGGFAASRSGRCADRCRCGRGTARAGRCAARCRVSEETARAAAGLVRHRFTDPQKWVVSLEGASCPGPLRRPGCRNVIVSNHVPVLEQLVHAVDAVFSSAVVGEKPHPRFFLHVLDRSAGRHTCAWWVTTPSPTSPVARAVGIPALRVDPGTPAGPRLSDAVDAMLR